MSTKPEVKQEAIARLLNGEKDLQIRCALELGYDAGWSAALEAAARIAERPYRLDEVHGRTETGEAISAAIRKLKGEPS